MHFHICTTEWGLYVLIKEEREMVPMSRAKNRRLKECQQKRKEHLAFCRLFPNIIFGSRASMWSVLLTADPLSAGKR